MGIILPYDDRLRRSLAIDINKIVKNTDCTWLVPSQSRPGGPVHTVTIDPKTLHFSCSCEDFNNTEMQGKGIPVRPNTGERVCKHILAVERRAQALRQRRDKEQENEYLRTVGLRWVEMGLGFHHLMWTSDQADMTISGGAPAWEPNE